MATAVEAVVRLRRPHEHQLAFIASRAKRKVVRAGRRSGKTTGVATVAVSAFVAGFRVLYAAPTAEQIDTFWREVKRALVELLAAGLLVKNETLHTIERLGTLNRIRAKTAWNADTLRGDTCDLLILDEYQLMDEDAWALVGAPMLLDNNGDAVFVYTPPSLHSRSVTKARDPRHAAKLFQQAQYDTTGRWKAFHFTSHDNPYISTEALQEIGRDMTALAIRQEILAEDLADTPGALWSAALLEQTRIARVCEGLDCSQAGAPSCTVPHLRAVVVGVDPPGGTTECGIVVVGKGDDGHLYILADYSLQASPDRWAGRVLDAGAEQRASSIVGEANYGGDMVEHTIQEAARARGLSLNYRNVQATRGKAVRAEPIAAMFEQGRAHMVGRLPLLEEELCSWVQGFSARSPNRLDAMVWAATELRGAEPRLRWI